jgi:hypothetical protein
VSVVCKGSQRDTIMSQLFVGGHKETLLCLVVCRGSQRDTIMSLVVCNGVTRRHYYVSSCL